MKRQIVLDDAEAADLARALRALATFGAPSISAAQQQEAREWAYALDGKR